MLDACSLGDGCVAANPDAAVLRISAMGWIDTAMLVYCRAVKNPGGLDRNATLTTRRLRPRSALVVRRKLRRAGSADRTWMLAENDLRASGCG